MRALSAAQRDLEEHGMGSVPPHLRGTGFPGARALGHGEGYKYPHDFPGGSVEQQYLPEGFEGRTYWQPDEPARKPLPSDAEAVGEDG
jgi:putative ATPase